MKKRYSQITDIVRHLGPSTIIEIGTWTGKRGLIMIDAALAKAPSVHYTGYDLFEHSTDITDTEEFNVKKHISVAEVTESMSKVVREKWSNKASFSLIVGNTRDTLKLGTTADFVFIDGGHSVTTIAHDYQALSQSPVIILDDYYVPVSTGNKKRHLMPDIDKYGCNKLVESIRSDPALTITTLPQVDRIVGGNVQLVLITRIGRVWPINNE